MLAHFGNPLIDVRSPEEYNGERTSAPAYPEEGALRAGHIPTAASVPWARAAAGDGTFKIARRARRDLPRRGRPAGRRRRDRLLPHRRALEPHLVRAHPPARLRAGAQLRRLVDRVGQRRARADRHGRRARRGPRPADGTRAGRSHARGGRMEPMDATTLPARSPRPARTSSRSSVRDRLQLLLEFSNELPELPERYADHPDLFERVEECQSPVFIFVEVERRHGCTCTRPRRPSRRRRAASPRSSCRASTAYRSTRCSTCPPTTRSRSASPRRCRRCACAA